MDLYVYFKKNVQEGKKYSSCFSMQVEKFKFDRSCIISFFIPPDIDGCTFMRRVSSE